MLLGLARDFLSSERRFTTFLFRAALSPVVALPADEDSLVLGVVVCGEVGAVDGAGDGRVDVGVIAEDEVVSDVSGCEVAFPSVELVDTGVDAGGWLTLGDAGWTPTSATGSSGEGIGISASSGTAFVSGFFPRRASLRSSALCGASKGWAAPSNPLGAVLLASDVETGVACSWVGCARAESECEPVAMLFAAFIEV